MANSECAPRSAAANEARRRLRLILDRVVLLIVSLSIPYWMWVRLCTSDSIRGLRALTIPGTIVLLLIGGALMLQTRESARAVGKLLVLSCALFWLATFYFTGLHTVYFLQGKFLLASAHKVALCATACFALTYFLATIRAFVHRYPRQINRVGFWMASLVVIAVSIDLWFCVSPPVEPAMVGQYLYRRQFHPVFTYAELSTYATSDARERSVRDYRGTLFQQVKPPNVVRIVLSGASTVWGHGLDQHQTLRSQLESKLRTRMPDRQWEVVCVAYQGKFQLNELVDTVAVLPQWNPDLVISLNGYNEIWYGETPGRYFGQPYTDEQTRLGFTESVLARLTHIGPVVSAIQIKPRLIAATDIDSDIPPLFYNQLRLSARTLKGLEIPYAYSFCPNVFELSDAQPEEIALQDRLDKPAAGDDRPKSVVVRERRRRCELVVQEENQIPFDVMALLQGAAGIRFTDECHLSPFGTGVLASALVERIPQWLETGAQD